MRDASRLQGSRAVLDKVIDTMREWDGKKRDNYMKIMLEKGGENDIFLRMMEKIGEELLGHLLSCVGL